MLFILFTNFVLIFFLSNFQFIQKVERERQRAMPINECRFCERTFSSKNGLRHHLKSEHEVETSPVKSLALKKITDSSPQNQNSTVPKKPQIIYPTEAVVLRPIAPKPPQPVPVLPVKVPKVQLEPPKLIPIPPHLLPVAPRPPGPLTGVKITPLGRVPESISNVASIKEETIEDDEEYEVKLQYKFTIDFT